MYKCFYYFLVRHRSTLMSICILNKYICRVHIIPRSISKMYLTLFNSFLLELDVTGIPSFTGPFRVKCSPRCYSKNYWGKMRNVSDQIYYNVPVIWNKLYSGTDKNFLLILNTLTSFGLPYQPFPTSVFSSYLVVPIRNKLVISGLLYYCNSF